MKSRLGIAFAPLVVVLCMSQDALLLRMIRAAGMPVAFLMQVITFSGDYRFLLFLFGLLWVAGYVAKTGDIRDLGQGVICSLVLVRIVVETAKFLIGRARPFVAPLPEPFLTFAGPTLQNDFHSFPSGHATNAFAVAAVVSIFFPPFFRPTLIWAILVALSRVTLNQHFVSDVVAGGLLGYCGACVVAERVKAGTLLPKSFAALPGMRPR